MTKKIRDCTIQDIITICDKREANCIGWTGEYELEEGTCPFYDVCNIFSDMLANMNQDLLNKEVTLSDTDKSAET